MPQTVTGAPPPAAGAGHASWHNAFTSHGCPAVRVRISSCASAVNACPVSSVCCASSARVSAPVKSPSRNDFDLMLKALPPRIRAFCAVERMR
ncbi:MAG: hypothetical protein OXG04_22880 [Acidobacteria bacterium]|nr:hypothetical protein [Acidobacteriota bacterium]